MQTSRDVELSENVIQMGFDCFFADAQGVGNFFVGEAFGEDGKHLLLPHRQPFLRFRIELRLSACQGAVLFFKKLGH